MAPTAGTRLRFKAAKSRKPQAAAAKKLPSLKNRIRALERFLQRGGIEDATRAAKKQELEQLRKEHEKKTMTELEKQNAEKYKKFRFVERVKLMRKLKQAKVALEQASSKAEKAQREKDFEHQRQELMYVFYFPKAEPYISLFPSSPHDEDKLKRQNELRAAAIARFEKEQPLDAFHQFCYNDGKSNAQASSTVSAAELLLKKPSKEEQKRKSKKPQSKKDKKAKKAAAVVLADRDDDASDNDAMRAATNEAGSDGAQDDEEERDDFFL